MLMHWTLGTYVSTGQFQSLILMRVGDSHRLLTTKVCMGWCTAILLRGGRQANCGYPTVAFCRAICDVVVLVVLVSVWRVYNRMRRRRNKSNHGYPMVVAMTITSRLILQRGGSEFIIGWVTNHGYPVLVTRPTVCRVRVCRGIGMVRAHTRW